MNRLSTLIALTALHAALTALGGTSHVTIRDGDTIAFLGDSITAGGAGYDGYCRLVIHGLKTRGIYVKGVFAGVPGNTSADMLLRLDRDVLDHSPDHVVIAAGVNDIWHSDPTVKIGVFQASPGMGVLLEHYKGYVSRIVDRCIAAGAGVLLTTITPITEDPEFKLNKQSETYSAFLKSFAAKRELPIADLNTAMFARIAALKTQPQDNPRRRNVLTSDGVHPLASGHQEMAAGILRAMGFTEEDMVRVQQEWDDAPTIHILGDRQTNAGRRTGGWCHMVLDGLNAGRERVSERSIAKTTVAALSTTWNASGGPRTSGILLLQAPKGDVDEATPLNDYRKRVESILERAKAQGLTAVVATIPMLDGGRNDPFNQDVKPYNAVLRQVCEDQGLALADIHAAMSGYSAAQPDARLTQGDARLNHIGGMLMAETVLKALGRGDELLAKVRPLWDQRTSYTFKGAFRAVFEIPLSDPGMKTLDEITARYHGISPKRLIPHGIYLLMNDDPVRNRARLANFERFYVSAEPGASPYDVTVTLMPSAKQSRAMRAYMDAESIDKPEFYRRAFKVAVVAMRNEDPLGRGAF